MEKNKDKDNKLKNKTNTGLINKSALKKEILKNKITSVNPQALNLLTKKIEKDIRLKLGIIRQNMMINARRIMKDSDVVLAFQEKNNPDYDY